MNENQIHELIKTVGIMSELLKVFYDENIRCGFDENQSLELTKTFMGGLLKLSGESKNEE